MTTTQHPERRAGQTWRRTIGGRHYDNVLKERADWGGEYVGWLVEGEMMLLKDDLWTGGFQGLTMTLLADVPAAAPLAADRCKAPEWCGYRDGDSSDPRRKRYMSELDTYGLYRNDHYYCSEACVPPPLAAQPAETARWAELARCGRQIVSNNREAAITAVGKHEATCDRCQPAPQPDPAKPVCIGAEQLPSFPCFGTRALRFTRKDRPAFLLCEGHYLHMEATINTDSLTNVLDNPKYPERLERPKLAHSYGVEDPALEDVS